MQKPGIDSYLMLRYVPYNIELVIVMHDEVHVLSDSGSNIN